MLNNLRVIDADGHLMDFDDLIRPYLPERFQSRIAPFYPLENWDRDLGGTLGKHWVRDVSTRLTDMDVQGIDLSVLYPTVDLFIGRVCEPELAIAPCRAYNDCVHAVCSESTRLRAVAMVQLHDIPEEADESLIPTVAAMIGEDVLLYASNYPYWDMDYPDSAKELRERTDLSERVKRKILGENARRVYRLE